MEASIKEPNIRNFVRLLQCASKFGEDLNMHANKDVWELAVTNSSKSAFCLFKLKRSFFCRYAALGETAVDKRKGVKCQILVKSVLSVLGKASSVANVERVDLTIVDPDSSLRPNRRRKSTTQTGDDTEYEDQSEEEPEAGGIEAKLIMKILCRHGVTKKHSLHLGTSEFLRAEVDPNSTPSFMAITARALRDMLDHFSIMSSVPGAPGGNVIKSENQLGWMFAKSEVRVKSWEGMNSLLSTEIQVDPGEFEEYWVEGERVDLTIPMKEFRAALTLAEQLNIKLNIAFSEATQPITLTSDPNEADDHPYDIFCAIATTNCDAFATVPLANKGNRTPSANNPPRSTNDQKTPSEGRSRLESEVPAKRKRSTLSLSAQPAASQTAVVVVQAPESGQAQNEAREEDAADESEPLFLPTSQPSNSQEQPVTDESDRPFPPVSQTRRLVMTQQEVFEMSGLGDMNAEDLLDALDNEEREDELQEMEALSQRNDESLVKGQDGLVMDQTIPLPGGHETDFQWDESIFKPGPDEPGDGEEQAGEDKENQVDEAEDEEMGDEYEFTATQAQSNAAGGGGGFTTFFD